MLLWPHLLRHVNYRFFFELTPYSPDRLVLVKVELASPAQMLAHLSQVASHEMKSLTLASQQISANEESNQPFSREEYKAVRKYLEEVDTFTREELSKTGVQSSALDAIVEQLCHDGDVGDMGKMYLVIRKGETAEK